MEATDLLTQPESCRVATFLIWGTAYFGSGNVHCATGRAHRHILVPVMYIVEQD